MAIVIGKKRQLVHASKSEGVCQGLNSVVAAFKAMSGEGVQVKEISELTFVDFSNYEQDEQDVVFCDCRRDKRTGEWCIRNSATGRVIETSLSMFEHAPADVAESEFCDVSGFKMFKGGRFLQALKILEQDPKFAGASGYDIAFAYNGVTMVMAMLEVKREEDELWFSKELPHVGTCEYCGRAVVFSHGEDNKRFCPICGFYEDEE